MMKELQLPVKKSTMRKQWQLEDNHTDESENERDNGQRHGQYMRAQSTRTRRQEEIMREREMGMVEIGERVRLLKKMESLYGVGKKTMWKGNLGHPWQT
jgi:hypothetical protein